MKIVVFGTCNCHGVGQSLAEMLPEHDVSSFEYVSIYRQAKVKEFCETVSAADLVFADLVTDAVPLVGERQLNKSVILFPNIVFTGFHPDCTYIKVKTDDLPSPIGVYHSAIAISAFSLNLSVEETIRLYNAETYERLGYFDEFGKAIAYMSARGKQFDLDIETEMQNWGSSPPFMWTINHPTSYALGSTARILAVKAGIVSEAAPKCIPLNDRLSNDAIFPVYPEIANRLGFTGSTTFKRRDDVGAQAILSLHRFIEESYRLYKEFPADALDLPKLQRIKPILANMASGRA